MESSAENRYAGRGFGTDLEVEAIDEFDDSFDDLFERYTSEHRLTSVKTSNMGSLFKLRYMVKLKNERDEKSFIDDLRCRNGNLEIAIMEKEESCNEL